MSQTPSENAATDTTDNSSSIWENDLPAGDSPPLPAWPLKLSVTVYVLWLCFLIVMMVMRLIETAPK